MNTQLNIDCSGLPAAIAVLRIKQAIQCSDGPDGTVMADIGDDCCRTTIRSGLRGDASKVSFKGAD